ncbi:MAG: metal ABC transporter ATP-binding protein [Deltaproteobacteria bacterium]|nr:metal ABC transporter ATP-binding protein [Deltaproteobacteria bacterium]
MGDALEHPVIALQDASLGYGAEPVLEGVDLQIHAGDFVGLSGANGSGKTTLLRSMLGLLPLRGGRVERHLPRARLGYVPQSASLSAYFPLSVWEVAAMGAYGRLRPWRLFPGEERRRVDTALDRVGLARLGRTAFAHLSGGQRQRALIARALTMEPALLLLDEPFSGVDRDSKASIAQQLVDLNHGSQVTIVLCSHDSEILDWTCERVIRVSNGGVHEPA